MRPQLIYPFLSASLFDEIDATTPWLNNNLPRDECFMALEKDLPLNYTYANNKMYSAGGMTKIVKDIMGHINVAVGFGFYANSHNREYDICFLNRYEDGTKFLGWHADDSPEMDPSHPICTVSFGSEREIWVKEKGAKGDIPPEDKYSLPAGSIFEMPARFQESYLHRIPKTSEPVGPRISLTFRKYKK